MKISNGTDYNWKDGYCGSCRKIRDLNHYGVCKKCIKKERK